MKVVEKILVGNMFDPVFVEFLVVWFERVFVGVVGFFCCFVVYYYVCLEHYFVLKKVVGYVLLIDLIAKVGYKSPFFRGSVLAILG